MKRISWEDFERVEIRAGTVVAARPFPEARKPSLVVEADFGPVVGNLRTSAQVTDLYDPADLVGRQIVGVVNLADKQIGPVRSQFLLAGFYRDDGSVVLAVPDQRVPDGAKLL